MNCLLTALWSGLGVLKTLRGITRFLSYSIILKTQHTFHARTNHTFLLPIIVIINPLKPNDPYRGRTAPLTSKRSILYIYSTNIVTEYFKHGIYSTFFPLQNAVCFIILTYFVPVLFTFYVQGVLKLKKK